MKKNRNLAASLYVAGSLIASVAMADTSTAAVAATAPRLIDKILVTYFGSYQGPTVTDPFSRTTPNSGALGAVTNDSVQNLDSTVTLGYKITDTISVTGNYRFVIQPSATGVEEPNPHYITKDPWVAVRHAKLISRGAFNMSVDLRGYIPVQTEGLMNTAIRSTQISTYEIPNSRLSVGLFTVERYNFLQGNARDDGKLHDLEIVVAPLANYQMTSTVAATLFSDIIQYKDTPNLADSNDLADLSLGVSWDVTPKINLNPTINMYPTELSLDKSYFGLIISARLM